MGAGYSDLQEIEGSLKTVLQDRAAAVDKTKKLDSELKQKEIELKRREKEYQDDLGQLLQQVEEQEKKITALKEGIKRQQKLTEVEKAKAESAFATLNKEFNENICTLRGQVQLIKLVSSGIGTDHGGHEYSERLNVGLFGPVRVGKTSLLNSLKYAIQGELDESEKQPVAPLNFQGGHTRLRYSVGITPHITFLDNRGIRPEDLLKGSVIDELRRQLEGRKSFAEKVDWCEANPQVMKERNVKNMIYSTILVFDARDPSAIGPHGKDFLEVLKEWQGHYPAAVITHVDVSTQEQVQITRYLLETIGIDAVYEVANITNERKELEPKHQSSLLRLIERCMRNGEHTFLRHQTTESRKK